MLMTLANDDDLRVPEMPSNDYYSEEWQNPDPLSASRGIFHAFLITAAVLAIIAGVWSSLS